MKTLAKTYAVLFLAWAAFGLLLGGCPQPPDTDPPGVVDKDKDKDG